MLSFKVFRNAYQLKGPDGAYLFRKEDGSFIPYLESENCATNGKPTKTAIDAIPAKVFDMFLRNYTSRLEKNNMGKILTLIESFGGEEQTVDARKSMARQLIFTDDEYEDDVV